MPALYPYFGDLRPRIPAEQLAAIKDVMSNPLDKRHISTCRDDGHGTIEFFNSEGKHHKIDGAAITLPDGDQRWFIHGLMLDDAAISRLTQDLNAYRAIPRVTITAPRVAFKAKGA